MKNKDFMVVDIFSQYMLVVPDDGAVEMMDIDKAKDAAKNEAQIGRIIDTGNTTKDLFKTITENLDSTLNCIFDFLNDADIEEFKKFGKLLELARDTYIYNKDSKHKDDDGIIGEFAVYDMDTSDILRNENYDFIHHSYSEVGETVNNFYFVDMTTNSHKILTMLSDQYEVIYNISEVMLLEGENYMDKIESSISALLDLYSSHGIGF